MYKTMTPLLKALLVASWMAPLALAIPTEVTASYDLNDLVSDENMTSFNGSDEEGANRVMTGFSGGYYGGRYPGGSFMGGYPGMGGGWGGGYYGQSGQCQYWCPSSMPGSYQCCGAGMGGLPGCPRVRDFCPTVYPYSGPPQVCTTSNECRPGSLCCFDVCLKQYSCKPMTFNQMGSFFP